MKLLYIAGDNRSGSTLLDMLIAGHSRVVTLGEAHQLRAYVRRDTRYYRQTPGDPAHEMQCYCGSTLDACEFWQEVQAALDVPLDSLELKLLINRTELRGMRHWWRKLLWLSLNAMPSLYEYGPLFRATGGEQVGRDSIRLYEAVARASGAEYVLDSSKVPHRMYAIAQRIPEDTRLILLCRDFKGTVYSKVKRGIPMLKAALQWKWTVRQMERFSRMLPAEQVLRVRYEDICRDTISEMQRICRFLDLPYEERMISGERSNLHHLGGSPSKYTGFQDIRLDTGHEAAFSPWHRKVLYAVVRREAAQWGYGA